MKKLFFAIVFILASQNYSQSAYIYTNWNIARWFLDADLVIVCHVTDEKTISISKQNFIDADGYRNKYEIIKEVYCFATDSIIKGKLENINQAVTPEFSINKSRERTEKIFNGFDDNNDSTFIFNVQIPDIVDYDDNTYFRPPFQEKCILFLKKNEKNYDIVFQKGFDKTFVSFLNEVQNQGEDFFKPITKGN